MSFLIKGNLLSLGGVMIHTRNLYPFYFKMEKKPLKPFVKCKQVALNMEVIKFADNFPLDIFFARKSKH